MANLVEMGDMLKASSRFDGGGEGVGRGVGVGGARQSIQRRLSHSLLLAMLKDKISRKSSCSISSSRL